MGPTEPDNVDDAPEPDVDESAPGAEGHAPAEQKITTKFLTKYERGGFPFATKAVTTIIIHSSRTDRHQLYGRLTFKTDSPARILGTRALQLSMGAPPMVEVKDETDPLVIAKRELQDRKIPITIRRFLPDGTFEDWTLEELNVPSMADAP